MARPQKAGIDYFSLDVDMDQDDKVLLIEAKHKITGFAVLVKLLMKIYKEGYFYKWTEREQLLFSNRISVDTELVNEIVNDCIKWDLFNPEMYKRYDILTSSGIQKRYIEAISRRKEITLILEYLTVEPPINSDKLTVNLVNADINPINVDINPTQGELIPTLIPKVKESKAKQNKSNKTKPQIIKKPFGEKVLLSDEQYQKLIEKNGESETKQMIEILDNWYVTKGKPLNDSDYHTMIGPGWVLKRFKEDQQKTKTKTPNFGADRTPKKDSKYDNFYL
jgi:hypothetical protein